MERKEAMKRALVDPSAIYPDPEAVLNDHALTRDEKKKILMRWEFDMAEMAVATEEGMPHDTEDLTRRILLALRSLEHPTTRRVVGPGKHRVGS